MSGSASGATTIGVCANTLRGGIKMLGDKKSPCDSDVSGYFGFGKVGDRALLSTFVELTPRTTLRRFLVESYLDSAFSWDQAETVSLMGIRPVPPHCCENLSFNLRKRAVFMGAAEAGFNQFVGHDHGWGSYGDWSTFDGGARTVPVSLALEDCRDDLRIHSRVTSIPHDVVPPLQHRAYLPQPHRKPVASSKR